VKPTEACDFFFTGAAILPAFLAYADEPALACMAFVVLILAGAVAGIGDPEAPHRRPGQPASHERPRRPPRR
jgi:hypothetical protein